MSIKIKDMSREEKLDYMKLLNIGDKIVIINNRPSVNFSNGMTRYLGKILKIENITTNYSHNIVFNCVGCSIWDFNPSQGHLNLDATISLHQESKKQSLKTELLTVGRVVECRDGALGFVLPDRIIYDTQFDAIETFTSDLLNSMDSSGDIMKVFDAPLLKEGNYIHRSFYLDAFDTVEDFVEKGLLIPIWERDEIPVEVQELMCQIEQKDKQIKFAQKEKECLEEEKQELEKELQKLKK